MFRQLTRLVAATGTTVSAALGAALSPTREPLDIYLNDHLLGATFGTELAARIASVHRESPEASVLDTVAAEIRQDRGTLRDLMDVLGVPVRRYKVALGWAAEKAGRLKPNGHLFERSDLSDLVEIETMRLGVEGKSACWRTLRALADHDDRLEPGRLDALLARAERQASALEELRVRTAEQLVS